MPHKTISLSEEAYERLKAHRRGSRDSFTQVVLRARWDEDTTTASELLEHLKGKPPHFSPEERETILQSKSLDIPPPDKWNRT